MISTLYVLFIVTRLSNDTLFYYTWLKVELDFKFCDIIENYKKGFIYP